MTNRQLNRRVFLASTAGIAVGAALGSVSAYAGEGKAEANKPEFSFALITDTHLGRRGVNWEGQMRRSVEEVNRSAAELCLFCGDLVDCGEKPENEKHYPVWLEIAKGLKAPYVAVPGNHDPVEMFRKHIHKETDTSHLHKGFRFVCFRDAEPNPGHDGIITPEQLQWLKRELAEADRKSQRVILMAHVIFHHNQHPDIGWYIKQGREEFAKLLAANKQVLAFFAGHFHCGLRGWDDTHGVQEVVLPANSWNANRGLQKAPGYALQEFRPGWTLVDVYADKLLVHYRPVVNEAKQEKAANGKPPKAELSRELRSRG
jgi:3',5'-cyclic AMP phosphodiesterase CpdA